jgi:hypothetical protein
MVPPETPGITSAMPIAMPLRAVYIAFFMPAKVGIFFYCHKKSEH